MSSSILRRLFPENEESPRTALAAGGVYESLWVRDLLICSMRLISDDELERLAAEHGRDSYLGVTLAYLRERRAKDEQVYCFELGEFLIVSPIPTPEEEVRLEFGYRAAKHMKGSRLTNMAEVIAALGEPNDVVSQGQRMTARIWVCSSCSEMVTSNEPIPVPTPCMFCGGIAFKQVRSD